MLKRLMSYLGWFTDRLVLSSCFVILLEVQPELRAMYTEDIRLFFSFSTWFFIVEIALRIVYKGKDFLRSRWDLFDLAIVALSSVSLLHGVMALRFLRLFRMVRLIRLFSINMPIRNLMKSLVLSCSRVVWTSLYFLILFAVYATIEIKSFGPSYPEFFGTVGDPAFIPF